MPFRYLILNFNDPASLDLVFWPMNIQIDVNVSNYLKGYLTDTYTFLLLGIYYAKRPVVSTFISLEFTSLLTPIGLASLRGVYGN